MNINACVIPAAGLGSRFLPFTKAVPKELLPILNKPAIHYIVEEALRSGITNCCIITSDRKQAIKDYFTKEDLYTSAAAKKLLESVHELIDRMAFSYIVQHNPKGLGHAISLAHKTIGNEHYFGIMLPDDLIYGQQPALSELIHIAQTHNASVIAVQEVPAEKVSSYGIISYDEAYNDHTFNINKLIEKPSIELAPSRLGIIGRYILSPKIFTILDKTRPGSGGEIQLTDAIETLLSQGERIIAYKIDGTRFDLGSPQGWIDANNTYNKTR